MPKKLEYRCIIKNCKGKLEVLRDDMFYCSNCKRDYYRDNVTGKIKLVGRNK